MNKIEDKANFETYEKVKKAPTDWRKELSKADQQLHSMITQGKPLGEISVTKLVQLDHDKVVELQAELDKYDNEHQLYTFQHDGIEDTAALIVLVPKVTENTKSLGRSLVTTKEYNRFIDDVLQEKVMYICRNSEDLKEHYLSDKMLGYDFSLIKQMLNRELNSENKSKLARFLEEKNLSIEVVETRNDSGITIRKRTQDKSNLGAAPNKPNTPRVVVVKSSPIQE